MLFLFFGWGAKNAKKKRGNPGKAMEYLGKRWKSHGATVEKLGNPWAPRLYLQGNYNL